nr:immunoglobulin heavy chain junction region [Macaca mulatta]MOV47580.1 immunoglobulin heavy chain junction region [Macaca mulatta]MOV47978.1 immunoglobulin heavy chain junction region [Macaca mulatta]MOV48176.1 immunoglobulin heavy chain junction region [Macaca mulatta]MOV48308.1 immunoglobulin heavy chain junction region [Macaca mulatta]
CARRDWGRSLDVW